jgi:hypothetical protein
MDILIIFLAVPVLVGLIIALLVFIPPVRKVFKNNARRSLGLVILFGAFSALITAAISLWLFLYAMVMLSQELQPEEIVMANRVEIATENFLETTIGSIVPGYCFSERKIVCETAANFQAFLILPLWVGGFSFMANFVFVTAFTRSRNTS